MSGGGGGLSRAAGTAPRGEGVIRRARRGDPAELGRGNKIHGQVHPFVFYFFL